MSAIKRFCKVLSWLLTALLALALAANLYTIAMRHITGTPQPTVFGWSWAVIISGSMEPEIHLDDLVIVHEEPEYNTGDVITFESGSSVVTHRIVAEGPEGFTTRGDANNAEDQQPVHPDAVIGKVVCVVPGVGRYISYMRSPLGMLLLVLLGFGLIELPYLWNKRK